jgi:hypothetical protein
MKGSSLQKIKKRYSVDHDIFLTGFLYDDIMENENEKD